VEATPVAPAERLQVADGVMHPLPLSAGRQKACGRFALARDDERPALGDAVK
jgi:hypothetical protein